MKMFNQIPGNTRTTFLQEFSKLGLSKVTLFEVGISHVLHYAPGLATFMECLPSVETLVTEKPFLLHLCGLMPPGWMDPPPAINFPMLKTLRLRSFTFSQLCWKSHKDRDPVSRYIMERIRCGRAISVIDFTEMNFDVLPNMGFLTKVNGVKVIWRQSDVSEIQEYISGTSAPQRLEGV